MAGVQGLQQAVQSLLDLLFPPRCAACQRSGSVFCSTCLGAIQPLPVPQCQRCGIPQVAQPICERCLRYPLRINSIRAVAIYQEPLRPCIHALKYKGCTRVATHLGTLLAQAYQRYGIQADVIVPVPLHKERERQRGYNQAHLLAQICATLLGLPLWPDAVQRRRATSAQVGLTGPQRRQNVADAFVCPPPYTTQRLLKRRILLIDDVATTGATLEACATPLFAAGALAVSGLVLARPFADHHESIATVQPGH